MTDVGERITVDVGAVAHGGHCVARHEGQVVFVRHTLPGERVVAVVTAVGGGSRFLRADAVEILIASNDRREPPCRHSGPGGCGGCDWQHVTPVAQRLMKAQVVAEAMRRQGGITVSPEVEPVPGDESGLHWRTRATFAVDESGRVGFHPFHSHDVVPVDRCLLVTHAIDDLGLTARRWPRARSLSVVSTSTGEVTLTVEPAPARESDRQALRDSLPSATVLTGTESARLHERVLTSDGQQLTYVVSSSAFWQVHPGAPRVLVHAVIDGVAPRAGDHVVDLYAGAGLFGVAMASILGPGGRVDCVESDPAACSSARRTVHDQPTVRIHEMKVDRWLATSAPKRCDLVVLDPPESGAGKGVLARAVRLAPRAIAYVSCDPASLGRDVALLSELGWQLDSLRAFDLFPTTHHVECVAVFRPRAHGSAPGAVVE